MDGWMDGWMDGRTTDGTPGITSKNEGLVTVTKYVGPSIARFNHVTHQEAVCSECATKHIGS
jgi:hypothetical protein